MLKLFNVFKNFFAPNIQSPNINIFSDRFLNIYNLEVKTMDTKKIVFITAILMIAISSLSMVSAGWFDFEPEEVTGEILNSSVTWETVEKMDLEPGQSFRIDANGHADVNYTNETTINYTLIIKLNATDDQLKKVNENLDDSELSVISDNDTLSTSDIRVYNSSYSLDGNILTINVTTTYENYYLIQDSGQAKILSGNITFQDTSYPYIKF